jgi:hypothetical protein
MLQGTVELVEGAATGLARRIRPGSSPDMHDAFTHAKDFK